MKFEYLAGVYVLGVLVVTVVSIYTADFLYFTRLSAVAPIGYGMVAFFIIMGAVLVIWEWKSPQFFCNKGHYSINATKDIIPIPWQVEVEDEKADDVILLTHLMFLTGGIDYGGFSTHSGSDKAVFICPGIYVEKIGNNFVSRAIYESTGKRFLPLNINNFITNDFSKRIKEKSNGSPLTEINYGVVAHVDGTATPKNLSELLKQKSFNRELAFYTDREVRLYDSLEKDKKIKEPTVLVGKHLSEATDGKE